MAQMMRASPLFFAEAVLGGPPFAPFFGKYRGGPHHLVWDRVVTREQRWAVMACRGSGKSHFFTFAVPLHRAYYNVDGGLLIISSTDDNARRALGEIKNEIIENKNLNWLYPGNPVGRIWRSRDIVCSNGFRISVRGVGARIRGIHIPCIGDDILSEEHQYSQIARQKVSDYWFKVVSNIPLPGQMLGLTGTPLNAADLIYYELRENPIYSHSSFPIVDDSDVPLWPEFITRSVIEQKKLELGSLRYSQECLCEPISSDASLFPRSLFTADPQMQMTTTLGMPKEDVAQLDLRIAIGVDVAFSASTNADYFVIFVAGAQVTTEGGNLWILDIFRERGMDFQDQLSAINDYALKYNAEVVYIESNQAQRIYTSEMKRKSLIPVKEYQTGAAKHSLEKGMPQLRLLAEARKMRIPRGDARSIELTDIFLDELASFTFQEGKVVSMGKHDDVVHAFFFAVQGLRWLRGFDAATPKSRDTPKESAPSPYPSGGFLDMLRASGRL